MNANELFTAFSEAQQAWYAREAEARWGDSLRRSSRKWKAYPPERQAQIIAQGQAITQDLLQQISRPPTSAAVQANIARWHQHLRHYFEPSAEALRELGSRYNDDPPFNATYQKLDPRLAPFMRSAIDAYCQHLATAS
jgi:hypothetical protein